MSDSPKRGDGKGNVIKPTSNDKRYVKRDRDGRFTDQVDAGRSLSKDVKQRRHAKKGGEPGRGPEGDQPNDRSVPRPDRGEEIEALLAQTSGLWTAGDGLAYQQAIRGEWTGPAGDADRGKP